MTSDSPAPTKSLPAGNPRWRRRIITIGLVLAGAAGVQWHRHLGLAALGRWHHWKTGATGVGVETAREMVADGALLIDVREPAEFEVSHLSGAINIPLNDLLAEEISPATNGGKVVLYCTIGRRSGDAAVRLSRGGIESYNLIGGIIEAATSAPDWVESPDGIQVLHIWSTDYAWLVPPEFSAVTDASRAD